MKTSFITKFAILVFMVITATWGQAWKSGATTVTLSNGTLTASGNGAMEDYTVEAWPPRPWDDSIKSITSIVIEEGITRIGDWAFAGLSIESVTISGSVEIIGQMAFAFSDLISIIIPNNVKEVGSGAFEGCTNLVSITLGNRVIKIGGYTFYNCHNLTSIISLNPIPPNIIRRETFDDLPGVASSAVCLYVPAGSINAYRAANVWSKFKCIKDLAEAPKGE